MTATDNVSTRSFTLTEKGKKFLDIIKEILTSPYSETCLRHTDACKEAVAKLESGKLTGIERPDSQFLLLHSNLCHNLIGISCEEILKTEYEKVLEKARILLKVRDAMWLYPSETSTNRRHPFFDWNSPSA